MLFGARWRSWRRSTPASFSSRGGKRASSRLIEMMASLPSVVLGFIAGLVIAPLIEDIVPTVLACFFTVPLAFLFGAQLWRLLPRLQDAFSWPVVRFPLMVFVALPLGILCRACDRSACSSRTLAFSPVHFQSFRMAQPRARRRAPRLDRDPAAAAGACAWLGPSRACQSLVAQRGPRLDASARGVRCRFSVYSLQARFASLPWRGRGQSCST